MLSKRDALLTGTIVVATLAVTLTAAEAALRIRERHRGTLDGTMPLLFYRHGRLGYALVHDYDYFGRIHVDREGFRGPEVEVAKRPGFLRIMAVGSSTTFDQGVSADTATWPSRLQYWLHRLSPSENVEVINAGVPGYKVVDDLIRLETELYQYRPDLIVLYEGHNDLFSGLRAGRQAPGPSTDAPGEVPVVTPWEHWLGRHSLLYGKLIGRLKVRSLSTSARHALAHRAADAEPDSAILRMGAANFERDVTCFLAVAQALGAPVAVVELVNASGVGAVRDTNPTLRNTWSHTVPFASPETVLRGYVDYNAALEESAKRFNVPWVPTGSFGLEGTEWYAEGDPIHFNDRGADRMAHSIAERLLADVLPGIARTPMPHR